MSNNKMWYVIAGRLMSLVCYFVLVKLFINFNELHVADKSIGWFLFEHIYEEYGETAGKFFMVDEDFRSLIKNLLLLVRNLILFSFLKTLLEFFFIILLTLSYLFLFFYLVYLLNVNELEGKDLSNLVFLYFYGFLFIIFSRQLFVIFTWYDIYFLFKSSLFFLIVLSFIVIACFCIDLFFLEKNIFNFVKLVVVKVFSYVILITFLSFSVLSLWIFPNLCITNNVIQEICLNLLFFYTYFYYS